MDFKEKILLPNIATMTVLDPISTEGLSNGSTKDLDELMQKTRQNMLDVFVKTGN